MFITPSRVAFFALGAAALLCTTAAQATDPALAFELVPVRATTQPPPKKDREYQLWHYSRKGGWVEVNGSKNKKHSELHKKGKSNGRTHVHPRYWNEGTNAVATAEAAAEAKNEMLFTVTLVGERPVPTPTPVPPRFCVHYCNSGWVYRTSGSNYQQLYDDEVSTKEFRDPSEPCDAPANPVLYFTIGAEGDRLGDGTICCSPTRSTPCPVTYAPCPPVVVCVPEPRKHCLLGGLLRSRRGGFCSGR